MATYALCTAVLALALFAHPGGCAAEDPKADVTLFQPHSVLSDPVAARKLLQEYYSTTGPYYNGTASCGSWSSQTQYSNSSGTYEGYKCDDSSTGGRKMLQTVSSTTGPYSNVTVTCTGTTVQTPTRNITTTHPVGPGYKCPTGGRKLLSTGLEAVQHSDVVIMLPSKAISPVVSRHLLQVYYEGGNQYYNSTAACGSWSTTSQYSDDSGTYAGYNCTQPSGK